MVVGRKGPIVIVILLCPGVIGVKTGKILGIGMRNKYCDACRKAEMQNNIPKQHNCYKNWTLSSPAMEPDIILDLFLQGEKEHGVRYMTLIGDGDAAVMAKLQQSIPVWGPHIHNIECAIKSLL